MTKTNNKRNKEADTYIHYRKFGKATESKKHSTPFIFITWFWGIYFQGIFSFNFSLKCSSVDLFF